MTPPVLPMDKCGFFAQIYVVINPRSGCLVQVRTVILVILVSHSCAKVGRLQEMGYLNLLVEGGGWWYGVNTYSSFLPINCSSYLQTLLFQLQPEINILKGFGIVALLQPWSSWYQAMCNFSIQKLIVFPFLKSFLVLSSIIDQINLSHWFNFKCQNYLSGYMEYINVIQ